MGCRGEHGGILGFGVKGSNSEILTNQLLLQKLTTCKNTIKLNSPPELNPQNYFPGCGHEGEGSGPMYVLRNDQDSRPIGTVAFL